MYVTFWSPGLSLQGTTGHAHENLIKIDDDSSDRLRQ